MHGLFVLLVIVYRDGLCVRARARSMPRVPLDVSLTFEEKMPFKRQVKGTGNITHRELIIGTNDRFSTKTIL